MTIHFPLLAGSQTRVIMQMIKASHCHRVVSMSQCSITLKECRANNTGGIARTIGGIEGTYSR